MAVMIRRTDAVALALCGALALAGCTAGGAGASRGGSAGLRVVASFYPLQWLTQQVAGDAATVTLLTKAGAEPHDLELSPRDVAKVADADLIVYLKGFQPAVDDAVRQEGAGHAFDVSSAANLSLTYRPIEGGLATNQARATTDPHFWLDPLRLAAVTDDIAGRLAHIDPRNAAKYRANAELLKSQLRDLDQDFRTGLARCANEELVTSHNAFGYLAQRYGLKQVGITGLTPDQEPSAADLADVATFVRTNRVRTIYYETLGSPAIARAVAHDTGARTEVLDPIERLTKDSAGRDYLQIMRSNLTRLKEGQPCS